MSELFNKKEYLKNLILRVKDDGTDTQDIKKELKKAIGELSPLEISQVEQELIENGQIDVSTIQSVCNVHLQMFKEYIENEKIDLPDWHPISILMKEHTFMMSAADNIRNCSLELKDKENIKDAIEIFLELNGFISHLADIEAYFQKEENILFPFMEKYGVKQPPAVMWKEHDQIRKIRKELSDMKNSRDLSQAKQKLEQLSIQLSEIVSMHIYKEHSVLFPTALKLISEDEWKEIRTQFDEIGYAGYTPDKFFFVSSEDSAITNDSVKLPSGELGLEQLMGIFNTLPVDITFIDNQDSVRYFSENKDRIFVRSRAIIGRHVQNCHPEKSVHIVNQILEDFKSKKRDSADFWLNIGEKTVYIRYFAVRDTQGQYLGTLEVTQDIAPIRKISGEKRIYSHE
jgi:hypothetical protein